MAEKNAILIYYFYKLHFIFKFKLSEISDAVVLRTLHNRNIFFWKKQITGSNRDIFNSDISQLCFCLLTQIKIYWFVKWFYDSEGKKLYCLLNKLEFWCFLDEYNIENWIHSLVNLWCRREGGIFKLCSGHSTIQQQLMVSMYRLCCEQ